MTAIRFFLARRLPWPALLVLVALLGAPLTVALAQGQPPGAPASVPLDPLGRPLYVPGEVLVAYKQGLGATSLGAVTRNLVQAAKPLAAHGPLARHARVTLPPGQSVAAALAELRSDPAVESADPNYYNYPLVTPTDFFWAKMWGLYNTGQTISGPYPYNDPGTAGSDVDAQTAWNTSTGIGVIVAVIDSGVDYTHPDLDANIWTNAGETNCADGTDNDGNGYTDDCQGWDFANGDKDPMRQTCTFNDSGWHGTHVAGTVAAEASIGGAPGSGQGIPGIAYNAKIMALKVFADGGDCGAIGAPDSTIAAAIGYAVANGAQVINLSLGHSGTTTATMTTAVGNAVTAGVLVVAAAGNSNNNNDVNAFWPTNYAANPTFGSGVIAVMASDQADYRATFSNYGATTVSIAAPGVNIGSTFVDSVLGQDYVYSNGTSMASPMVAGIAALVLQVAPSLTPAQLKARIIAGGDPVSYLRNCTPTGRRANAANAVGNTSPGSDLTPDGNGCGSPAPPVAPQPTGTTTSGSTSLPCLITWATEDWLADAALDPLRRVREDLRAQGPWGEAVVRGYYRTSAMVLGWLGAAPAAPTIPAEPGALSALAVP